MILSFWGLCPFSREVMLVSFREVSQVFPKKFRPSKVKDLCPGILKAFAIDLQACIPQATQILRVGTRTEEKTNHRFHLNKMQGKG